MNLRCLRKDWLEKFHDKLLLVETFVDPSFFQGTVYKASNWKRLGRTKGYTKCGKRYIYHGQIKEIYIYILDSRYREILGVPSTDFLEHRLSKNVEETSLSLQQSEWTPKLLDEFELTDQDFDSIAQELTQFHNIFSDCFCRSEQESLGLTYISGLMSATEKNRRKDRPGNQNPSICKVNPAVFKNVQMGSWCHAPNTPTAGRPADCHRRRYDNGRSV